ncbi:hypothetical protein DXG01_005264 [Tephrocybe rancida]|nr:hypothetical protein DXG01_005264 [Tephrocybe rancida]
MEARHILQVCALIKEIQTHYKASPEEKPAAEEGRKEGLHNFAAPPAHAPATGPTPEPQCVTHTPALPTPRTIPYVLVPCLDMSLTSRWAIDTSLLKNTAPKQVTLKQVALKQVAPKAGHGLLTPAAKALHPVPHALPKPPQQRPKQGKDGPPPPCMDINEVPCKRCVKNNKMCYIRVGKDRKEGACYACNAKVSCNLALKRKGKVQE